MSSNISYAAPTDVSSHATRHQIKRIGFLPGAALEMTMLVASPQICSLSPGHVVEQMMG